jgi:chromate reductase, NAD(P)H dehydrogenase (quinone)
MYSSVCDQRGPPLRWYRAALAFDGLSEKGPVRERYGESKLLHSLCCVTAPPTRVLMVPGSLRAGSTNTALLRTAEAVAPEGITALVYEGLGDLPLFNPDDDREPLNSAVSDLRIRIAGADALLFSTPEYAGALPGPFKNLLDWTVGGGETYGKPVAWVNASGSPTGAVDAHRSLRTVLGYTGSTIIEAACGHIPIARSVIGADGLIADGVIRKEIADLLGILASELGKPVQPSSSLR